jgi:hypothetical protein
MAAQANSANGVDPQTVFKNLKDYIIQPKKEVIGHPLRSVVYSLAIKTLATVAFYLSQVASGFILGFSIFMIDRIIVLNFNDFRKDFLADLYENPTFKSVIGVDKKMKREVEAE